MGSPNIDETLRERDVQIARKYVNRTATSSSMTALLALGALSNPEVREHVYSLNAMVVGLMIGGSAACLGIAIKNGFNAAYYHARAANPFNYIRR